ncbi:ribose ABC transporter substrate-binding protein, partial [Mesorhizobium sp. M7A.F.Ca.CA.001.16.1.1]
MTGMIRGLLAATALASLATTAFAQDVQGVIGGLPTELKAQYDGAPQKVLPSAWDNFTAPPKPWKWCHSESYQGNPWRVTVTKELKRLVDGLIADGTVSSFEVSDSNNDASQQINQIRAFIDKKCSIITSIPGSATALDDAIDAAAKAGIPFITAAGSVTSPNAINVDSNYA